MSKKDVARVWVPFGVLVSPRLCGGCFVLARFACLPCRAAFPAFVAAFCRVWGCLVASSSFVPFVPAPSSVLLGGVPAVSVGAVPSALGFSGGVVVGSSWVSRGPRVPGSRGPSWVAASSPSSAAGLAVWFRGSPVPLVCLSAALSPSCFALLVASVSSACASGAVVFPVVAAVGGVAPGFLCGLSASGPAAAAPVVGCFSL